MQYYQRYSRFDRFYKVLGHGRFSCISFLSLTVLQKMLHTAVEELGTTRPSILHFIIIIIVMMNPKLLEDKRTAFPNPAALLSMLFVCNY